MGKPKLLNKTAWVRRRRKLQKKLSRVAIPMAIILVAITATAVHRFTTSTNMADLHYNGLLGVIAKGESNGNYNAYYRNANNTEINFTSMSIEEVMKWQRDYVKSGSPSSAVGKYQIIRPTLNGLVNKLGLDKSAKFDEAMQDRLAIALLERRGLKDYVSGKTSQEQFAHNLSKEWAALPKVMGEDPHNSYYAGDGLNKVQVSVEEINTGIASLHQYK